MDFGELATVSSQGKCLFNGKQLSLIELGMVEYSGKTELFQIENCSLECGSIYGLVGPNGKGKSSFAKLLASKSLPGFENINLTTNYLNPSMFHSSCNLTPFEYLQNTFQKRCIELKTQIEELENELELVQDDNEMEALVSRISTLYELEEDLTNNSKSELMKILEDLQFPNNNLMNTPVRKLSSGWRYKIELASNILSHPELLIIDEPSFLDINSTNWLVRKLKQLAKNGVIIILISHKENLLEKVVDRVLFISASKKLEVFNCDYVSFKNIYKDMTTHANKVLTNSNKEKVKTKKSLKYVKNRISKGAKTLETRLAKGEDRRFIKGRSEESKQRAGKSLTSKLKQLEKQKVELEKYEEIQRDHIIQPIPIQGTNFDKDHKILSLQNVSFQYDTSLPCILNDISTSIYGQSRIVLEGPNGAGKSTLIKLIMDEISPTNGTISNGGARCVYFPQNALHQIVEKFGDKSPTDLIKLGKGKNLEPTDIRIYLGKFGLKGNLTLQQIRSLSAGQLTRLYLANEFFECKPSLLILDEVENLDSETSTTLLESLQNFQGAVLLVSHNESFVQQFKPKQKWTLDHGTLKTELTTFFEN